MNYYQLAITMSQVASDLAKLSSTLSAILDSKEETTSEEEMAMNGSYPITPNHDPISPTTPTAPTDPTAPTTSDQNIKFLSVPSSGRKLNRVKTFIPRSKTPLPLQAKLIDRPSFDELTVIYGGSSSVASHSMTEFTEQIDSQSTLSASPHNLTPIPNQQRKSSIDSQTSHNTQISQLSQQSNKPNPSEEPRPKLGKIFIRRKKA
jgi:hypothetical protein